MNLEHLRYEIDEELREEERKEIKEKMKDDAIREYYKKKWWGILIQDVKCVFGKHLYNRIPSLGITTCPCCTRVWNNPYKGLRTVVNGSLVGYSDFEQSKGDK